MCTIIARSKCERLPLEYMVGADSVQTEVVGGWICYGIISFSTAPAPSNNNGLSTNQPNRAPSQCEACVPRWVVEDSVTRPCFTGGLTFRVPSPSSRGARSAGAAVMTLYDVGRPRGPAKPGAPAKPGVLLPERLG